LFLISTLKEDGSIELRGTPVRYLFGAKVESYSDEYEGIPEEVLLGLYEKYFGSEKPVWLVIGIKRTKVRGYPDSFRAPYRTEVLYLFQTKEDRNFISSQVKTFKPLGSLQLANTLFRFHSLVSPYYFTPKGLGLKGVTVIKPDTIYSALLRDKYKDFLLNEFEKRRCEGEFPFRIYKSLYPVTENPNLEKFFKTPWEGVAWIKVGLGNFYGTLRTRSESLSLEKSRFWKEVAEKHRSGSLPLALVEITFLVPKNRTIPQTLGQYLGVSLTEWYLNWSSYVFDPLFSYEDSCAHFFTIERTASVMPSSFGKTGVRKGDEPVYIYGMSPSPFEPKKGEAFYFHLAEEGKFHSFIVAPQRSGKSVTNQIIISQLTGVDVKALYYGKVKPFRFPVKVVQFDVGFSAEFFVELLRRRGFSVNVFPPDRTVKINPLEVDSADEVPLAVSLINLLWETKGGKSLSVEELGLLEKGIRELLEDKGFWIVYGDREISSIERSHPHLYRRALEKGLKPVSLLREAIKLGSEFKTFDYPVMADLLRKLKQMRELSRSEIEKRVLEELIFKVNSLTEIENFSTWSSISFTPVDYLYIDLHYVKEIKELFVPLYLALLTKVMKLLSRHKFSTPKYVSVDEFHNFVSYEAFVKFFETLVREAAKRNIYLTFISQNVEDVPERILYNVRTRIILKGQEGSSRESDFIKAAAKRFALSEEAVKRYAELPRYSALITYGEGEFFGASFPITEASLKVFESRKIPVLKTPDGITIKKTFVEEE